MELLQSWLESSQWHLLSAFILGLMMAVSPCPLMTNITAIGYIGRNTSKPREIFLKGSIYTLGRAISYTALGIILYSGVSSFHLEMFFNTWGEKILGPFLLIIGILMLEIIPLRFPSFLTIGTVFKEEKTKGYLGALGLGMVYALAFCPYSGILFFGMLIPLSLQSSSGLLLPPVFAIGTGIPVLLFAWILAFAVKRIDLLFAKVQRFDFWFRKIVALSFIIAGLYFIYLFYVSKYFI